MDNNLNKNFIFLEQKFNMDEVDKWDEELFDREPLGNKLLCFSFTSFIGHFTLEESNLFKSILDYCYNHPNDIRNKENEINLLPKFIKFRLFHLKNYLDKMNYKNIDQPKLQQPQVDLNSDKVQKTIKNITAIAPKNNFQQNSNNIQKENKESQNGEVKVDQVFDEILEDNVENNYWEEEEDEDYENYEEEEEECQEFNYHHHYHYHFSNHHNHHNHQYRYNGRKENIIITVDNRNKRRVLIMDNSL